MEDIPWDSLPEQFAMKWNFGAGYNIICSNKNALNIDEAKRKMGKWGKCRVWLPYAEMQYKNCKKRIIVEKYLQTDQGFLPYDYKLYCFNGKVKAILVIGDRDLSIKGAFFDKNWNYLGVPNKHYQSFNILPEKPEGFSTMIKCAETLSNQFPFLRIDFYDYNGIVIFGEMTFSPAAGLYMATVPIDGKEMGEYLRLESENK